MLSEDAPLHGELAGKQHGFTLIELIAVIVVLGILAAFIVPRYTGVVDTTLTAAARAAGGEGVARLQGASRLYTVDTGSPPGTLADISNSTYLNLGAGNTVSIGSFVLKYTALTGSPSQVMIQVMDSGGTNEQYSLTINWP